jgi:hypothetical protein
MLTEDDADFPARLVHLVETFPADARFEDARARYAGFEHRRLVRPLL